MTDAEMLAVAVLKGDKDAILPLLDCLLEQHNYSGKRILPHRKHVIDCPPQRLKAIVFCDNAHASGSSLERVADDVRTWLEGEEENLIAVAGIKRIEIYQFPEDKQ